MKEQAGEMNIPYHIHGDEFVTQSSDRSALEAYSQRVQEILDKTAVEIELPNGKIVKADRIGVSYGIDKTLEAAEEVLKKDKETRKLAGLRTGDRGKLDEFSGKTAERVESKAGDTAELRTDVEPRAKPVQPEKILPEDIDLELKDLDSHIESIKEPDLDIPVEQVIDAEGDTKIVTKKAGELLDEIEADEKSIDDIVTCYGGVS